MGYVDEVIVGKEVATRLPELVPTWIELMKKPMQAKELKKPEASKELTFLCQSASPSMRVWQTYISAGPIPLPQWQVNKIIHKNLLQLSEPMA